MPLHFDDIDVLSQVEGLRSALIVPCNMCPAVTVAVRDRKPFLQIFQNFLKSAPFDEYLAAMQGRLAEAGVRTKVFRSILPHSWFLCFWTAARQKKLKRCAQQYDGVIVLGCQSATITVRNSLIPSTCKVIEGMTVSGIMNATLSFSFPGNVSFEGSTIISLASAEKKGRVQSLRNIPVSAAPPQCNQAKGVI